MNTRLKTLIGSTGVALLFLATGCQKKDNYQPAATAGTGGNSNLSTMSLVTSCPSTCTNRTDTVRSGWVAAANVGNPAAWTFTAYYNLESGEVSSAGNYHFTLSGQFLSKLTAGTTLGYFDSTSAPPSAFASITCSDTTHFSTSGVVGNAMANHTTSAHGWYIYNYMNPFLVSPSWVMGLRFASCGKYYAVKLTVFVTSRVNDDDVTEYRANVVVQTKCLGCGA